MKGASLPAIVAHADWSVAPAKRWLTVARARRERFHVEMPRPVGSLASLLDDLLTEANGGGALVAFDFPIGVPQAYADLVEEADFIMLLAKLGQGEWSDFYKPAGVAGEVTKHRPFYPDRPGGKRQAHLCKGLNDLQMHDLLRQCERQTATRPQASSLFWTLGSKQVGKGAIVGWEKVLAPALRSSQMSVGIWPFQGDLKDLLSRTDCVIAEAYPAEACITLGLPSPGKGWSKGVQRDRAGRAERLLEWATSRDVSIASDLRAAIRAGFPDGDDQFDSLLGTLAAIEVLARDGEPFVPSSPRIRSLEGWILGQGDTA